MNAALAHIPRGLQFLNLTGCNNVTERMLEALLKQIPGIKVTTPRGRVIETFVGRVQKDRETEEKSEEIASL